MPEISDIFEMEPQEPEEDVQTGEEEPEEPDVPETPEEEDAQDQGEPQLTQDTGNVPEDVDNLKLLRDIVFSDDQLFQQVLSKARQLSGEESPDQNMPEQELQPPEYPEDDTDPETMRKYFRELNEYNQKQTQLAIQKAIAEERKRAMEYQQKMQAEMERKAALDALREEYGLDSVQMNEFLKWASNPTNGDLRGYFKTLYRVYQEATGNQPKKQEPASRLSRPITGQQNTGVNVNAANIGGSSDNPANPHDLFNEMLLKAYKRNRKVL